MKQNSVVPSYRERRTDAKVRRLPVGAEPQVEGGVHFRVWAPDISEVAVEFACAVDMPPSVPMEKENGGYFSVFVPAARAGMLYRFRVASGAFPDPASRFQPEGPHGPSEIVDPTAFAWSDGGWRGPSARGQVIYELHLGTFTPQGTWRAAMERLEDLRAVGVTMLEIMPVNDFSGTFGWGYDGVNLFAPTRLYGTPDDARRLVNRAHELGLAVILDVVYNHLGPDGNYLGKFAKGYFSPTQKTEWGDAINFDGPGCGPVREFFVANARYWVDEFRFDGLRIDATQQIFDASETHIVAEIGAAARAAGGGREVYVVAENEPQLARIVRPCQEGGYGLSAIWNDDFHHSAAVAATGRAEAYYRDHRGTPQEFISALKHGFLFQGQWYAWQQKSRGTPAWDVAPHQFVIFLQNHDQVANSLRGERLHQLASPAILRVLTAVMLLAPQTPMLFQGQEFAASAPFLYFADHAPGLRKLVSKGRRKFLEQFPSVARAECRDVLAEPGERVTFERCKLDWSEREKNAEVVRLHTDLLRLRREEKPIASPRSFDGAVLEREAFVLRYFSEGGDDRLLVVNLGGDVLLGVVPEPLLAPPEGQAWEEQWSSESPEYGGNGTPPLITKIGWRIPGRAALLLRPGEVRTLEEARLHEGH